MTDIELTQPAVTDEPVKPFDFNAALLELAKAREAFTNRAIIANQMRDQMYAEYVQRYDDEIEAGAKKLADMEAAIKAEARRAAIEGGDFTPHSSIEIKRKPASWKYDDATMLETIKAEGVAELIRVKEELNRVELNKALKEGKYPWLPATPTEPDVTVSIRPLGDLLIIADMAKAE